MMRQGGTPARITTPPDIDFSIFSTLRRSIVHALPLEADLAISADVIGRLSCITDTIRLSRNSSMLSKRLSAIAFLAPSLEQPVRRRFLGAASGCRRQIGRA